MIFPIFLKERSRSLPKSNSFFILLQELIFRLEGFKPFGWYLTLVQFAFYTFFGLGELQFKEDKSRR